MRGPADTGLLYRVQPLDAAAAQLVQFTTRKIAHDVSNVLVAALTLADMAGAADADIPADDLLVRLRAAVGRPGDVMRGALLSVRSRAVVRPATLADLQAHLRAAVAENGGLLTFGVEGDAPRGAEEACWTEVADILTQNALDAFAVDAIEPEPDTPAPRLAVHLCTMDGMRTLRVSDNGPGCPTWPRIAAGPTARAGHGHLGLGLGLAAARLAACGGTLDVGPASPRGAIALARAPWPGAPREPVERPRA